ncbi:LemA family protein [Taylorella equigenitalis]|uniref:LemA family protein n=1 Tax=Taylorella equigenitalis TaxID=29575 RepID=UPI00237DE2C5|nr:LemA family protein [Taylorella equigenitalis]WDU47909.1 LemA family protein [Taylorella equigenitalis]
MSLFSRIYKYLAIVLLPLMLSGCGYNELVSLEEQVDKRLSDLNAQFERRLGLIDNLVQSNLLQTEETRKLYKDVADARASATKPNIILDKNLTQEQMDLIAQNQTSLSASISRLLVNIEKYPNINFDPAFKDLRTEIAGTENRIQVAKERYNEAVKIYNAKIRSFPTIIVAKIVGFKRKPYYNVPDAEQIKRPGRISDAVRDLRSSESNSTTPAPAQP